MKKEQNCLKTIELILSEMNKKRLIKENIKKQELKELFLDLKIKYSPISYSETYRKDYSKDINYLHCLIYGFFIYRKDKY